MGKLSNSTPRKSFKSTAEILGGIYITTSVNEPYDYLVRVIIKIVRDVVYSYKINDYFFFHWYGNAVTLLCEVL